MPTSTQAWLQLFTNASNNFGPQSKALAETAAAIYSSDYGIFEIIGLLVTIALVVGIAIHMSRLNWIKSRVNRYRHAILNADPAREQTKKSWKEIERHFFAGDENDLKVAVIEADKALDNALRNAGVIGANLGDRLKKVKSAQLPNIEDVWQAHKLRNQIAHEDAMSLKRDLAEKALTIYKTALENLGALGK